MATASFGAGRQANAGSSGGRTKRLGALIRNIALWSVCILVFVIGAQAATSDFGRRMSPYRSGFITLLLFIAVGWYSVRKRSLWISIRTMRLATVVARPLAKWIVLADRLETWRAVHVIVGVTALLPFWWHMQTGLRGPLETTLLCGVVLLFITGFFGVFMQQHFPRAMTRRAEHEVRLQDVDHRIREVYVQAEEKILGHPPAMVQAYVQKIKSILLTQTPRRTLLWATIRGADPGEAACREAAALAGGFAKGDAEAWAGLVALAVRKVNLEHNAFNLHLSTGWLAFHIVLSAAVGILVVFHVLAVLYFYGT